MTREFYYNDAGVQIQTLANSVQARARGFKPGDAEWPESAYNGDYIADIANDFKAGKTVSASDGQPATANGNVEDIDSIRPFAVTYLRNEQDIDLQAFGVKFDNYYLESSLYADGKVNSAVETLIKAGHTYEQDGALWLRTTDFGDDKDRVMRKTDGTYTYFVPDVAYHLVKWQRGFVQAINIQGSDHHGTIARVRAGLQAVDMGIPQGYPDYVLHKMVTVMKDGEEVKISKRAGSYVTVRDLIEWSGGGDIAKGRDAVRFFLISRKADTEFVFDVDVALKTTDENPVYYVQYAHARICRILENWGGDASDARRRRPVAADGADRSDPAGDPGRLSGNAGARASGTGTAPGRVLPARPGRQPAQLLLRRKSAGRGRSRQDGPPGPRHRRAPGTAQRPGTDRRVRAKQNVIAKVKPSMSHASRASRFSSTRRQQGNTLVGIIIGLVIGLGIAVVVALVITKGASPFTDKSGKAGKSAEPTAGQIADPNKPMYGNKEAAKEAARDFSKEPREIVTPTQPAHRRQPSAAAEGAAAGCAAGIDRYIEGQAGAENAGRRASAASQGRRERGQGRCSQRQMDLLSAGRRLP